MVDCDNENQISKRSFVGGGVFGVCVCDVFYLFNSTTFMRTSFYVEAFDSIQILS